MATVALPLLNLTTVSPKDPWSHLSWLSSLLALPLPCSRTPTLPLRPMSMITFWVLLAPPSWRMLSGCNGATLPCLRTLPAKGSPWTRAKLKSCTSRALKIGRAFAPPLLSFQMLLGLVRTLLQRPPPPSGGWASGSTVSYSGILMSRKWHLRRRAP